MNEEQKQYVIRLLDNDLNYLQDNLYRHKHLGHEPDDSEIVKFHENKIKLNKEVRELI